MLRDDNSNDRFLSKIVEDITILIINVEEYTIFTSEPSLRKLNSPPHTHTLSHSLWSEKQEERFKLSFLDRNEKRQFGPNTFSQSLAASGLCAAADGGF